jgi:hypothetical protein
MHKRQREILRDNRRYVMGRSVCHGISGHVLGSSVRPDGVREINDFEIHGVSIIAVDECKELTPEVIEKLRAHTPIPLPPGSEFVQTKASDDWLARYVDNP